MRRERRSVRNLRRPRPLTLPLPLHDCGAAAADLPGGRPRKPAGVSSAARDRPTSKPRLSVPSRAGATSVRTRLALKTQGRSWEGAASLGGVWARAAGPALPRSSHGPPLGCAGPLQPRGAGIFAPPWCGPVPACDVAKGGRAYLRRSLPGTGLAGGAGPPTFPCPSLHASSTCSQVTTIEHAKSTGLL